MKRYIFCPSCSSGNTHELTGTNYRACENCGRLDFEQNFKNRQDGEVPVRFHEILEVKTLYNKKLYGDSQYAKR